MRGDRKSESWKLRNNFAIKTQADIAKKLDRLSIRKTRGWKPLVYKGFEAFMLSRTL